jgi:PIN domain nuclease of toxin-antitoxin system
MIAYLKVVQVFQQVNRAVVPEMPDRIITATALSLNVPIISRDAKIQAANLPTIW